VQVHLEPDSVKVLKIVDTSIAPAAPTLSVRAPETTDAGKASQFSAEADSAGVPVLIYRWNFGDGTGEDGASVTHAYTRAGDYTVHLRAEGLDGLPYEKSIAVKVTGKIDTIFVPANKKRLTQPQ
jgi:PKD repeat protein